MSQRQNSFPIPAVTTFGQAPSIVDLETRKAYWGWLLARVVYECFRWVCWTLLVSGVTEKVVRAIGMVY